MQTLLILALTLPWFLVAGQTVALYLLIRGQQQVLRNHQEIADRLTGAEAILARVSAGAPQQQQPSGLPVGTPAPDFALPDLAGRQRLLDEFLGKPFLVTFFSTSCGYCQQMAPRLGELPEDGPRVLLISRGDADEHLQLAAEHKWRCDVVLEPGTAVMTAYKAFGTPTGYLIDAEGRIASDLAVGADALLALLGGGDVGNGSVDLTAESLREKEAAAVERARDAGLSVRKSNLKREGLAAGTPAPDFTLPDLQGEQHRLEDFRDKRVLLVFSDPNCGPCDALAPELVKLQQGHSGNNLQVIMVSRGHRKENEQKAKQYGVSFPVLLQKRWEVSKDYAMFATPVAYLIDEKGVIAKDVAVGKSAILALV
jgi:peroxiredoxin